MTALPAIPSTISTPHSGAMVHGLRDMKSAANVSIAYCDMIPSDAIAPQRTSIVLVPATYIELRALSIVACMAFQLSWGVNAPALPLDSRIAHLPVIVRPSGLYSL